ncbi:hypothetical protein Ga0609869_001107 [Rhodovulum iodosum]|uniref:HTH marR-type domain-containing protein n=1 Tax=Rhodovulum iodosum TaxID=68291 RepID=A0ABV3XR13_9RHOB|nr:hypothetical protein [Rhodovulum robiginosum]RSK32827.1 hypothetical protein EJA01_10860 [Rhodovulum robiginosum]
MKSLARRRLDILKKIEADEYYLKFEEYSTHPVGGCEEVTTPDWTDEESYEIKQLVRRGYLEISATKGDEPWLGGAPDAPYKETYVFLTPAGHDFLQSRKPVFRALNFAKTGVGALLLSVLFPALVAWITVKYISP